MNTTDNPTLAAILEELAGIASFDTLDERTSMPDNWSMDAVFPAPENRPGPYPEVQGFVAHGTLDGDEQVLTVLALGVNWSNFQLNYTIGKMSADTQVKLKEVTDLGGTHFPDDGKIDHSTIKSYLGKRDRIWESLKKITGKDFYITGMGLGAPIAQLAALDLRPGNIGPGKQDAPSPQAPGYYFSAGNVVNTAFSAYYNSIIPNQFTYSVNVPGLTIDYFPTAPSCTHFTPLGAATPVKAKIPAYDEPWWERGNVFYQLALGGSPDELPEEPGNISNPPPGYSQTLAYTLSTLCAAAYQKAQHPDSVLQGIGNYSLVSVINSGGSPFAFIFSNNVDAVVLAFRGSITWEEFTSFVASSKNKPVPFIDEGDATMRLGLYNLYYAQTDPATPDSPIFADAVKAAVKSAIKSGYKLYITGHCLGGALANFAAADYAITPNTGIPPTALYTYGATMFADRECADAINATLAQISYQILRPADKIANAVRLLGFSALKNQLLLTGQMMYEEATYHSLTGYINLLNPSLASSAE